MRRRVVRWACLLTVLGLVVVLLVAWRTAPTHRITAETVQQVRECRTATEVEALFHVPAGNYATGPRWELCAGVLAGLAAKEPAGRSWASDDWVVHVTVAPDGRVTWVYVQFAPRPNPSWTRPAASSTSRSRPPPGRSTASKPRRFGARRPRLRRQS